MKRDNPFTLTFGKQPGEYISRQENTNEIISTFDASHPVCQSYLIEGVRGSGKTVLMTAVANELGNEDDWVIVNLNTTQDLMEGLAMRLADACERLPGLLQKGFNFSVAGFGIGINGVGQERDFVSIIEKILLRLKKAEKKVLITLDEVIPNKNLRQFASQFQIFVRQDYPVYLIMTGLFENIYTIQNDPALTFLLRTPKIRLEPLSLRQIANQYRGIFDIDNDHAYELAYITKGYAFAFQALGLLYFDYKRLVCQKRVYKKFLC